MQLNEIIEQVLKNLTSPKTAIRYAHSDAHFARPFERRYMRWSSFVFFLIITGCASKADMSSYTLAEFEQSAECNFNKQCKFLLYGYSGCGNVPDGYQGYFIYSTKIGRKNTGYLKKAIEVDRAKKIANDPGLWECILTITPEPNPICDQNVCIDERDKGI